MEAPIAVIGGGPAGSAAGRLLASWGHHVLLLDDADAAAKRLRGLAESLPPSARKLLAETGVLDVVERAGFYRSTGNTVWWASRDSRVETFGRETSGFQVYRPDFDRVLLNAATAAGVDVVCGAHVRAVDLLDEGARIHYERNGAGHTVDCRWVLDCSGRTGVVARRFRIAGRRMYALVGEWRAEGGWDVPDATHTLVEAYDSGWAWSVPIASCVRQVGAMIDGPSPRRGSGRALVDAYRAEIAKAEALAAVIGGGVLQRAWACDAATYSSHTFGGRQFLLVGDAGSFIDPLSSCGVKKALASAWVAAIVVNTCLAHPERERSALEFFATWERDVSATHTRRSGDFAREAAARHPRPFWLERATDADAFHASSDALEVQHALQMLRESEAFDFTMDECVTLEKHAVIRGREIVQEDALALPVHRRDSSSTMSPVRFVDNVDLVGLAQLASDYRTVPDLFEAYCRTLGPAPLPNVLGGLSRLVAAGVLRQRNRAPC